MAPYLLLDGHSLSYRAYFALKDANLVSSAGEETQAVYGFSGMLGRLLDDHSPAGLAVAFDLPGGTFRDEIADDYKAGRPETPDSLSRQIGLVRRIVELIGAPVVEVPGYEADDVLASLAAMLDEAGEDVIVVTGDRDAYQLVKDPHVRVLYNRRGVTDYVLYDEAGIVERTGVEPSRYPFLAALRGDPSDNLPGVPGVGEKTAAKLVNAYGEVDVLYEHLDELSPKLRASLIEGEGRVRQNLRLIPLVRDVEVGCGLEELRLGGSKRQELADLFGILEIRQPKEKILAALDRLESGSPSEVAAPPSLPVEVLPASDAKEARASLAVLAGHDGGIAVEGEWEGREGRSALSGLAFAEVLETKGRPRRALYLSSELFCELSEELEGLLAKRSDGLSRIVAARSKELMRALLPLGFDLSGLDLDLSVAGYLVDPSAGEAGLAELAGLAPSPKSGESTQLGFALNSGEAGEAIGRAAAERAARYAEMAEPLRKKLTETGSEELYATIERPLIDVLARMELAGVGVDRRRLEQINNELTSRSRELEASVKALAGEEFKVSSTQQLREVLFSKLGLTPQKKTKTGYSTDAQSLERLRGEHPVIEAILEYREVEKLRSTYGSGLLSEVAADGRIHASFNQTVARTGRLSSDQPNLHNIPVRSELGRQFREAFVPGEGRQLVVADYDQIELRVIAHLAEDPGLVEAFRDHVDIHSVTAQRVFGVDEAGVTPLMRSRAKMISYGLAYGMEAYGLAQRLAIEVDEAAKILGQYFDAFPNVRAYMTRTVAEARARGYTETLLGRRRYLPDLDSPNYQVRQAAERQAMNAGIQGLAADIFKVALVRLDGELLREGLRAELVLQVHDEVLVESDDNDAEKAAELTAKVMEGAMELSVPLAVHVARGRSWAKAKEKVPAEATELEELAGA